MDELDVEATLKEIYEEKGQAVAAIWHTHPNGVPWPSPRDICGWPNLALGWRYFVVTGTEILEWKLV